MKEGLRRKPKAAERTQDVKDENVSGEHNQVRRHSEIPPGPPFSHLTGKESGMEQNEESRAEAERVSPWGPEGCSPTEHAELQRLLPARPASICRGRRNFGLNDTAQPICFCRMHLSSYPYACRISPWKWNLLFL